MVEAAPPPLTSDELKGLYYDAFLTADLDWYEANREIVESYPKAVEEGTALLEAEEPFLTSYWYDIFTGAGDDVLKSVSDMVTAWQPTVGKVTPEIEKARSSLEQAVWDARLPAEADYSDIEWLYDIGYFDLYGAGEEEVEQAKQVVVKKLVEEKEKAEKGAGWFGDIFGIFFDLAMKRVIDYIGEKLVGFLFEEEE